MGNPIYNDGVTTGPAKNLVSRLHSIFSNGLPLAAPAANLKANELDLVRGVLQMLQGFSSSLFFWDDGGQSFCTKNEIYVTHLSQTSLRVILNQFIYGATCLQVVEIFIKKVDRSSMRLPPTLKAFASSVSSWLKQELEELEKTEKVSPGIWKKRISANGQRGRGGGADLPVMKEGANLGSEAGGTKQCPAPSNHFILPSLSALEHNIINLLEACILQQ